MAKEATSATKPTAPTSGATAGATAPTKEKRAAKAKHEYLNAGGTVVADIEEATGCRYIDLATKKVVDFQIPGAVAVDVRTMAAVFGVKTRMTNAASANRNALEGPNTDDVSAIIDNLGELKTGQWLIAGEGAARGPKWNLDTLAIVIADMVKAKTGKPQAVPPVRAKLETDLKYRRGAMANAAVKLAYQQAAGVSGPSIETFAVA